MNHGIHIDIPAAEYHEVPAASASKLKTLWRSTPAHLKAVLDSKDAPSPQMQLGTLAHSIILEPDKPLPGIVIQPEEYAPGKKWTNAAAACKAWRETQERAGLVVLKADEYESVFSMARAVSEHPLAAEFLRQGRAEVSILVHDAANNVSVKARIDFVPDSIPAIVDLKTTADASESGFMRRAYDLGYHIQAAIYLDLWNALMPTEARRDFYFVAVENTAPFAVNVFSASPEFLEKGREDYRRALSLYARCIHEDIWPAYDLGLKTLNLPKYANF